MRWLLSPFWRGPSKLKPRHAASWNSGSVPVADAVHTHCKVQCTYIAPTVAMKVALMTAAVLLSDLCPVEISPNEIPWPLNNKPLLQPEDSTDYLCTCNLPLNAKPQKACSPTNKPIYDLPMGDESRIIGLTDSRGPTRGKTPTQALVQTTLCTYMLHATTHFKERFEAKAAGPSRGASLPMEMD